MRLLYEKSLYDRSLICHCRAAAVFVGHFIEVQEAVFNYVGHSVPFSVDDIKARDFKRGRAGVWKSGLQQIS